MSQKLYKIGPGKQNLQKLKEEEFVQFLKFLAGLTIYESHYADIFNERTIWVIVFTTCM